MVNFLSIYLITNIIALIAFIAMLNLDPTIDWVHLLIYPLIYDRLAEKNVRDGCIRFVQVITSIILFPAILTYFVGLLTIVISCILISKIFK